MKCSNKFKGKNYAINDKLLKPTRMKLWGMYLKEKHKHKSFEQFCKLFLIKQK